MPGRDAIIEGRQSRDGIPGLVLCQAQLVQILKIQPKRGARAEEMGKAQSGIAGDGAPPLTICVMRLVGALICRASAHAEGLQFFGRVLPRMDRSADYESR